MCVDCWLACMTMGNGALYIMYRLKHQPWPGILCYWLLPNKNNSTNTTGAITKYKSADT